MLNRGNQFAERTRYNGGPNNLAPQNMIYAAPQSYAPEFGGSRDPGIALQGGGDLNQRVNFAHNNNNNYYRRRHRLYDSGPDGIFAAPMTPQQRAELGGGSAGGLGGQEGAKGQLGNLG